MATISIRVTDKEKEILMREVEQSGLSLSAYIKRALFSPNQPNSQISNHTIELLSYISTNANQAIVLKDYCDINEYLVNIQKGAAALWQILLS